MSRALLILCPDPIGERMSGMGIRYTEIARALAAHGERVVLAGTSLAGAPPADLECATWSVDDPGSLRPLLDGDGAGAVLSPPAPPHVARILRRSGARLAIDLYDPESLEVLERFRTARPLARRLHLTTATDKLTDALRAGDFFVCASERQRDLWLGAMLAAGRLTPAAYDADPTLRALIALVPFGVPAAPPPPPAGGADPIRARFPEIGADDPILLWNGGLWRWLDAPTAIRALARVRERGVAARLVFMGASTAGGAGEALAEARAAADAEGLLEAGAVLFNDRWIPYDRRGDWLLAADAAISTHLEHLETRFAFRTRLLDCFWAGLPPVVSAGDALAEEIAAGGLGAVAPPGDPVALADGIERVLTQGRAGFAGPLAAAAARHAWPAVVAPLRAFLAGEAGIAPGRSAAAVPPGQRARRGAQRITRAARVLRRR